MNGLVDFITVDICRLHTFSALFCWLTLKINQYSWAEKQMLTFLRLQLPRSILIDHGFYPLLA